MKITITRALAELKTLQARYNKAVSDLNLVAVKQGNKLRGENSHYKEEDFIEKAMSLNNKATGLYKRILLIKTSIDKSNSETTVTVGGDTMTIQEALVIKNHVSLRENYLETLKRLRMISRREYEKAESENQASVEKLIGGTISKEQPENLKEAARKEAEAYVEKTRGLGLVDPCGIDDLIEKTEESITEFKTNIDYVLSESNSTTYIEIPD